MLSRAQSFLDDIVSAADNAPPYHGSLFDDYRQGDLDSFKGIVIQLLEAYVDQYENERGSPQNGNDLIIKLSACSHYSAVYTHLAIAQKAHGADSPLAKMLSYAINFPMFLSDAQDSLHRTPLTGIANREDVVAALYTNTKEAALFETELAYVILQATPKNVLENVNDKIIDYLNRHKKAISAEKNEAIRQQLIQYKVCKEDDFHHDEPIDVYMNRLMRPLDINNTCELATLHLIFFNYNKIYQPERNVESAEEKGAIVEQRAMIHRSVRPKGEGEMFQEATRGRGRVEAVNRTREFGITAPEDVPERLREFHNKATTPHKYRACADPSSHVYKTFRTNHIPYIAGPSGTAADVLEGLSFLTNQWREEGLQKPDMQQYFNLLAAAEVALGHHSIHEVILPMCLLRLYEPLKAIVDQYASSGQIARMEDSMVHPWTHIDYSRSYEDFLCSALKATDEYRSLCERYPQFLAAERRDVVPLITYLYENEEQNIVTIQRGIRAMSAYAELDQGTRWRETEQFADDDVNLKSIESLSRENLGVLRSELGRLSEREVAFIEAMVSHPVQLTHYTNAADKIFSSGMMLSNTLLKKMLGDGNFTDNSSADIAELANGGFVFFRYELIHQTAAKSRFGGEQIIIQNAEDVGLLKTGFTTLVEQLDPATASVVKEVKHEGVTLREMSDDSNKSKIEFKYQNQTLLLDVVGTAFYGPNIKIGIALAVVRELRRIGGSYQLQCLGDLSPESMNRTLAKLFRVEVKIASVVYVNNVNYQYTAPEPMLEAVRENNADAILALIDKGMNIDAPLFSGRSALFEACSFAGDSSAESLRFLHNRGASLTSPDTTAAHIAAMHNNVRCLDYCLNHGVDLGALDIKGRSILSHALRHGQRQAVEFLLEKGLQPTHQDIFKIIKNGHVDIFDMLTEKFPDKIDEWIAIRDQQNNTLLHMAAEGGYSLIIQALLSFGVRVDVLNDDGRTPLHLAASMGRDLAVISFIATECDLNVQDINGETPLHLACRNGEEAVVYQLMSYQANMELTNKDGNTALHVAAMSMNDNCDSVIHSLVSVHGVDPNKRNDHLVTPLFLAAQARATERFLSLLVNGSNPMIEDRQDLLKILRYIADAESVVIISLLKKISPETLTELLQSTTDEDRMVRMQILQALVKNNETALLSSALAGVKDINQRDDTGKTYLAHACLSKPINHEVLTLLLNKGARPDTDDVSYAMLQGTRDTLKILLSSDKARVDISAQDGSGNPCFFYAVKNDDVDVLSDALGVYGANIKAEDQAGYDVLCFALLDHRRKHVEMLLGAGCDPLKINPRTGLNAFTMMENSGFHPEINKQYINLLYDRVDHHRFLNFIPTIEHGNILRAVIFELAILKNDIAAMETILNSENKKFTNINLKTSLQFAISNGCEAAANLISGKKLKLLSPSTIRDFFVASVAHQMPEVSANIFRCIQTPNALREIGLALYTSQNPALVQLVCLAQKADKVRLLFEVFEKFDQTNSMSVPRPDWRYSILMMAVRCGNTEAVCMMIDRGVNLSKWERLTELTPLEVAVDNKQWPIIIRIAAALKSDYKVEPQITDDLSANIGSAVMRYIQQLPGHSKRVEFINNHILEKDNLLSHILKHNHSEIYAEILKIRDDSTPQPTSPRGGV